MTTPARKPAAPRAPAPVHLSKRELEFARREGPLARLARESGRGNAHFGLDAWGHVVVADVQAKYASHDSYPMSTRCPQCGDAGNPKARPGEPGSATGPCRVPTCAHPALTFPERRTP